MIGADFYNDHDPGAVAWLESLAAAGEIRGGVHRSLRQNNHRHREGGMMPSAEERFFRWCWASLSAEQRNAMIVVAQTGAPNGRGVGHHVMNSLDQAGMTQLTTNLDDWFWTFTDLGESVMWEGAKALQVEWEPRHA